MSNPINADVGVMGIRLVNDRGEVQRHCARFPRWRNFVSELTGLAALFPRMFRPIILTEFDHLSDADVDHVIGAFYLVKRSVFENVGGFDPKYFVYMEDMDLSRRIALAGYRRRYVASLQSYHKGGGTSDAIRARRLSYHVLSRLTYAGRHFSPVARAIVWTAALAAEPLTRTAQAVLRGSIAEGVAVWQGYGLVYLTLARQLLPHLRNRS